VGREQALMQDKRTYPLTTGAGKSHWNIFSSYSIAQKHTASKSTHWPETLWLKVQCYDLWSSCYWARCMQKDPCEALACLNIRKALGVLMWKSLYQPCNIIMNGIRQNLFNMPSAAGNTCYKFSPNATRVQCTHRGHRTSRQVTLMTLGLQL